jgi:hypothetical protein
MENNYGHAKVFWLQLFINRSAREGLNWRGI